MEPPETPAPVFAARALKSAIFGTPAPAPYDDDTSCIHFPEKAAQTVADNTVGTIQPSNMSPTKPPGILMTPGTATTRRKTVSFGHEVVDKEVVAVRRVRKTNDERKAGQATRSSRVTPLTRALENARDEKSTRDELDKPRNSSEELPLLNLDADDESPKAASKLHMKQESGSRTNQNLMEELSMIKDFEGDMTMDLNEPHSESGRYWKSYHEEYHEQAKDEMKKLLRYKQMAKNYAKQKDEENIDLAEKLREEQRRVSSMEDRLSKLSARIGRTSGRAHDEDAETPELIRELAKQTALAVQYRKQVEEFRDALEGNGILSKKAAESIQNGDGSAHARLLQEEVLRLQRAFAASEKTNGKLREENNKLAQDLLHADLKLERLLEKYEKHRLSSDEMRRKKDNSLDDLQKTYDKLKEQAKSQRRDAEQLLKKRHDQVTELRKEIASKRNLDTEIKELQETLQKKTTDHSRVVAEYEIRIAELKRDVILGADSALDLRASIQQDPLLSSSMAKLQASVETPRPRESLIPIASQSISRPTKAAARHPRSETPTGSPPKNHHQALSELINNANPSTIPPVRFGPVQFTPAASRYTELLAPNAVLPLPSVEHSGTNIPTRVIHERTCHASPRPSIVNIPSSPPKPVRMRSQESDRARAPGGILGSSRLSIMEDSRARRDVPPDRVAAARARLEQKNAEKRKVQEANAGKENIRN